MTLDYEEDSPRYTYVQEEIVRFLKASKKPRTVREIKDHLGSDKFLADALTILEFIGLIVAEGSVMLTKYRYLGEKRIANDRKVCAKCLVEKPLIDFYQEWAGSPSRLCKMCKIEAQKRRGRKSKKAK